MFKAKNRILADGQPSQSESGAQSGGLDSIELMIAYPRPTDSMLLGRRNNHASKQPRRLVHHHRDELRDGASLSGEGRRE